MRGKGIVKKTDSYVRIRFKQIDIKITHQNTLFIFFCNVGQDGVKVFFAKVSDCDFRRWASINTANDEIFYCFQI